MYLTEIAPFNYRGAFGVIHQLAITLGIFAGSVFGIVHILGSSAHQQHSNFTISTKYFSAGSHSRWPLLFLLELAPLTSVLFLPLIPESPRFLLVIRQQRDKAEAGATPTLIDDM